MSLAATVHGLTPLASLTASSESSVGNGSLMLVTALVLLAGTAIVALLSRAGSGSSANDDKPAGSILGFLLIALALGILYFAYLAPGTGSI